MDKVVKIGHIRRSARNTHTHTHLRPSSAADVQTGRFMSDILTGRCMSDVQTGRFMSDVLPGRFVFSWPVRVCQAGSCLTF